MVAATRENLELPVERTVFRLFTLVVLLLGLGAPVYALDPNNFVVELSSGGVRSVEKIEEVTLPDGRRKYHVRIKSGDSTETYVFPPEKFDEVFRVLGPDPKPNDSWMVNRSWEPQNGLDTKALGSSPARATILVRLSPDLSIDRVQVRMSMPSFSKVYEKQEGPKVDYLPSHRSFTLTPDLPAFRKVVPGQEIDGYKAQALKVETGDRSWIVPLERVDGGRYRAVGTDKVFDELPPGSLRYLNEREAASVQAWYAKQSEGEDFKASLNRALGALVAAQTQPLSAPSLPTTSAPLTLWQKCVRAIQALRSS